MSLTDDQILQAAPCLPLEERADIIAFARAVIAAHEAAKPTDADALCALDALSAFVGPGDALGIAYVQTIRAALTASRPLPTPPKGQ